MKSNYLFVFVLFLIVVGCKKNDAFQISTIKGSKIAITDSIPANLDIETFITPYRNHLNKDLDSIICYSPNTYSKKDGTFNTAIGNLMADAVLEQCNPIFKKRTGKTIDMVLLNYGGIRAIIPKGAITTKTAYTIMPFENSVVVTPLKKPQLDSLISYLQLAKKAHPIAGLQLILNKNFTVKKALINKKPINKHKTYYVATSDYLYNGGDNMRFLKHNDTVYNLDYKLRTVLIDYFKKVDTITPRIDDRFIQK